VGAAVGAVTGNFGQTVGAWAAGGGAGGLFYGILRGSETQPYVQGLCEPVFAGTGLRTHRLAVIPIRLQAYTFVAFVRRDPATYL